MLLFLHTPAVCGDALVAAVLLVPVFALHSGVAAAGAHTNVSAGSGSHTRDGGNIHLNLHLRDKRQMQKFKVILSPLQSYIR